MVDIEDTDKMNTEIQRVMEQHFNLSMSATITMSSLQEKLEFLPNTEFATNLFSRDVGIPDKVDEVAAMVLREIICLFGTLRSGHQVINLGEEQFRYYWRKFKEKTPSPIAMIHVGHYILAM